MSPSPLVALSYPLYVSSRKPSDESAERYGADTTELRCLVRERPADVAFHTDVVWNNGEIKLNLLTTNVWLNAPYEWGRELKAFIKEVLIYF